MGGSRPGAAGGKFDRDRNAKGGKGGLRVNREIRAPEVRVIDEDGTMLGIFPPFKALELAEERTLIEKHWK